MYTPVLSKSRNKSALSVLQATFNRYHRKIDQLHGEIEQTKRDYDRALVLYHTDLRREEKRAGDLIVKFVLKVRELTRNPKALTKRERNQLEELIEHELKLIFALVSPAEIPEELKDLYEEIYSSNIEEEFQDEVSNLKDFFAEQGVDVDLSRLNPSDSLREMMEKIAQTIQKRVEEPPKPPKKKSKKEMLKEQREKELAILQKKSLNNIYKRLAKVLHPDLEQDLERRVEKEELMKRLTIAYEKSDLASLLALESEWLGGVDLGSEILDEKLLRVYNSLLKEQVEDLEGEVRAIPFHPRYLDIQRVIGNAQDPVDAMRRALLDCKDLVNEYSSRLRDLLRKNPLQVLKGRLQELALQSS